MSGGKDGSRQGRAEDWPELSAAAHLILRIGKHVDKQGMSKIDAQDLSCCKKCIRVHFAGSVTRNRRS